MKLLGHIFLHGIMANINICKLRSMCRRNAFSALSGRDQHDLGPRRQYAAGSLRSAERADLGFRWLRSPRLRRRAIVRFDTLASRNTIGTMVSSSTMPPNFDS